MAGAFVNGYQGQRPDGKPATGYLKVAATAKRYAMNNVEKDRYAISSDTDDRTLRAGSPGCQDGGSSTAGIEKNLRNMGRAPGDASSVVRLNLDSSSMYASKNSSISSRFR